MLCSNVTVTYQCNVTGPILVWDIIPGDLQITLSFYDPIVIKTHGGFTAKLVKSSKTFLSSNLTFVASAKYNSTNISCYDGESGLRSASQCYPRLFSKYNYIYIIFIYTFICMQIKAMILSSDCV